MKVRGAGSFTAQVAVRPLASAPPLSGRWLPEGAAPPAPEECLTDGDTGRLKTATEDFGGRA